MGVVKLPYAVLNVLLPYLQDSKDSNDLKAVIKSMIKSNNP